MKNKIVKRILVFVIIIMSLFCLNKYINVKADSGWDSDYDSGSSWDSGSDWGSDSSWDSDSDSSSSGGSSVSCTSTLCTIVTMGAMVIIVLLMNGPIIAIIVLIIYSRKNSDKINTKTNELYNRVTREQILNIIPEFNIDEFETKAYQIFYDVQMGWMEFDYDKLKELLSDELYNMYKMDLEALKTKKQKNVMRDFELIESKMFKLEEENNIYIAKVIVDVKFIDYIEDSESHKVIKGTNNKKLHNTYILTFISSKKTKTVNVCPKCGAEVKGNVTGICEYCRTKFVNDNYDWVMSKKEKISQK